MKTGRDKGSLTIFSVLSLVLIAAALFSLLEGARLQEIKRSAQLQSELAMEAVFASYNAFLWDGYHLLGTDQSAMEEILIDVGNARYSEGEEGMNLLLYQVDEIDIEGYTLLTDGNGNAYIGAVSSYMKEHVLYEAAKEIYNQYEAIKSLRGSGELDLSAIDDALQMIEATQQKELEASSDNVTEGTDSVSEQTHENSTNLLDTIKKLQETGILELVIEDTSVLSQSEMDLSNLVSTRELVQGKNSVYEEAEWLDKILLQQYLLKYMSNYCDVKYDKAISYELEYLIGGEASDIENLKTVVTQLLAIREAANLLYLMTDASKTEEVEVLAMALVGVTANGVLIEVVKTALLTGWAFAESILDVRALLQGKKIPLLKNETLWTSDINNLEDITQGYATAKESSAGLSYKTYLGILLLFQEAEILAYHAMDVQEAAIRSKYKEPEFCIDHLMLNAKATITYKYYPVFPFLQVIDAEERWDYKVSATVNYGYE